MDMGSGGWGYADNGGGDGGGIVKIVVTGNANISGNISSHGTTGVGGAGSGGAGGSINLEIGGIWSGIGTISVNGGDGVGGGWYTYGSGWGGRIAVRYGSKTHTGNITSNGGGPGSAGTIYQLQQ